MTHSKKHKGFSEGMVWVFMKGGMGGMGEMWVGVRSVGDFQSWVGFGRVSGSDGGQ